MARRRFATLFATLVAGLVAAGNAAEPGHVTGVGGVFLRAKDPKALVAWYRDVLGVPIEAWGGAAFRDDAAGHPPKVAWSAFPTATTYFAPSTADVMIDYAVDDLDAIVERLRAKGVEILDRRDDDPSGRFACIVDPEGRKVELWEPKRLVAPR